MYEKVFINPIPGKDGEDNMKKLILLCCLVLLAGSTATASLVPPWERGAPGTTYQEWSFSQDEHIPQPDSVINPFGPPELWVNTTAPWMPDPGAYPLLGQIDVHIPNQPILNPEKEIWLQLTWRPESLGQFPFLPDQPLLGIYTEPLSEVFWSKRQDQIDPSSGWIHSLYKINIWPNPRDEWFSIKGDIVVDHLIIDTRCVPEPMTLVLFGSAGLVTLLQKKKKRSV
ncbi:MAG: PEP-CTERM sorting domain-containing protein [Planctomycetota bacterium]|jgi:hypothetical protein